MMRLLKPTVILALAFASVVAIAACGRSAGGEEGDTGSSSAEAPSSVLELPSTTPPAKGNAGNVVWAVYRPVATLDPVQAFDFPENTSVSALCESPLRQEPDGKIVPGLASLEYDSPTKLVLSINEKATFWDGKPVTAEDVAYSLNRNLDPSSGSFYVLAFARVKSIVATDPHTVTITMKQPDYTLEGELASTGSTVIEKAFAEKAGKSLGTPAGGTMCTGAYEVKSWSGEVLALEANPDYWGSEKPKTKSIEIRGVADDSSLTAGLETGEIDGTYPLQISTLEQLRGSQTINVFEGSSYMISDFVVSSTDGGLLEDEKVRQALSLAIDRKAYIGQAWKGAAIMPRTLANPGQWSYGKKVFEENWESLPEPEMNVAKAKKMIEEAGDTGKTLTIGMSTEISAIFTAANVVRTAAEEIGLKVKYKAVTAAQFADFFEDPKAREGVDGFPTVYYSNSADPLDIYLQIVLPGGSNNFFEFSEPKLTALAEKARSTADPEARARLTAEVGEEINKQLPWIPLALPKQVLLLNKELTGVPSSFSFMFAPWANGLGTTG